MVAISSPSSPFSARFDVNPQALAQESSWKPESRFGSIPGRSLQLQNLIDTLSRNGAKVEVRIVNGVAYYRTDPKLANQITFSHSTGLNPDAASTFTFRDGDKRYLVDITNGTAKLGRSTIKAPPEDLNIFAFNGKINVLVNNFHLNRLFLLEY